MNPRHKNHPSRRIPIAPPPDHPGERPLSQGEAYRHELEQQNAELHGAKEALEAARNRYMDLYDGAPVGFLTLGRHGLIREANLTAAELIGRDRLRLIDRPLAAYLANGQSPQLFALLRRVQEGRGPATTELRFRAPDGGNLPLRVDTTLSRPGDAEPTFLVTLTDLSEQKRLEAENRRSRRELEQLGRAALVGEIASTLAHDLNQPLAAIGNYAAAARNALAAPEDGTERAQEALVRLEEQVGYAGDLIRSVREMLRPSDTAQEAIDLNRVLADSYGLVRKFGEEHEVALHSETAADLPPITGNATQLKQVLVNLAINAVEAYGGTDDPSAEVLLRSRTDDKEAAVVEVIDGAGGMDEETRAHLFDPFYTTKSEGLGMGLAICRTIIESHGGALWAEPNDRGGTTMAFRIPADREATPD